MKFLLPLVGLVASFAFAETKFNLPLEVSCEGKSLVGKGLVVCAQDGLLDRSFRVKIPPTKGQFRVLDCDRELTRGGNPDDFNTQIEKRGWWIFAKRILVRTETPFFKLPNPAKDDCAIVASVYGDNTGIQTGTVIYESREMDTVADVWCGGQKVAFKRGVGSCVALQGADLEINAIGEGSLAVASPGCDTPVFSSWVYTNPVSATIGSSPAKKVEKTVKAGVCIYDIGRATASLKEKSRLVVLGIDRESRELDDPFMIRESGTKVLVYKPVSADVMESDIYFKDGVIFRSGPRTEASYQLVSDKDNRDGSDTWPPGAVICHTAYSKALQSVSGSCYNLMSGAEVPYVFR